MAKLIKKKRIAGKAKINERIVFSERGPGTTLPKGEHIITVFSRPAALRFAQYELEHRPSILTGHIAIQKSKRVFGKGSAWSLYHVGIKPPPPYIR